MENNLPSNSTNPSQENASQPPSPTNQNEIPKPVSANRPGMIIIAIAVVIIVIVLGVGGYFLLNQKTSKSPSYEPKNSTPIPTQSSKNEGTEETNLSGEERLLYAENGFSFYYPRSLEMFQVCTDCTFWRSEYTPKNYVNDALILRYSDKPLSQLAKGGTFNTYVKTYPAEIEAIKIDTLEEAPIQLGTKQTTMFTIGCGVDCYYHVVRFASNNKYYELIANGAGGGLLTRFNNILASFSFYDVNSKEWRTYSSKEGHYSVQYPANASFIEKVFMSVDGVRGYSNNLITIIPSEAGPIEGAFSVLFEKIGNTALDEYLKKNECGTIYENKRFMLNNEQAVYQNTACGIVGSSDVFVKHKDLLYTIGATSPEDPILATFKFID